MNVPLEANDRLTSFGNQLIETHLRLREDLARLREGTLPGRDLRTECLTFCEALTRHHEGEDTGAFPVIAREHPELRPVLDELRRDHDLIAEALTKLTEPDAELDTLAALLETHLVYEEKKLFKLLNALRPAPGSPDAENLTRCTRL